MPFAWGEFFVCGFICGVVCGVVWVLFGSRLGLV